MRPLMSALLRFDVWSSPMNNQPPPVVWLPTHTDVIKSLTADDDLRVVIVELHNGQQSARIPFEHVYAMFEAPS